MVWMHLIYCCLLYLKRIFGIWGGSEVVIIETVMIIQCMYGRCYILQGIITYIGSWGWGQL